MVPLGPLEILSKSQMSGHGQFLLTLGISDLLETMNSHTEWIQEKTESITITTEIQETPLLNRALP